MTTTRWRQDRIANVDLVLADRREKWNYLADFLRSSHTTGDYIVDSPSLNCSGGVRSKGRV